jgi:hypothetical protein
MNFVQAVQALVGEGVGRQAGRVEVLPDTGRVVIHPLILQSQYVKFSENCGASYISKRIIRCPGIICFGVNGDSHEVTPSFSHTTSLQNIQAVRVGWATCEPVGNTTIDKSV